MIPIIHWTYHKPMTSMEVDHEIVQLSLRSANIVHRVFFYHLRAHYIVASQRQMMPPTLQLWLVIKPLQNTLKYSKESGSVSSFHNLLS